MPSSTSRLALPLGDTDPFRPSATRPVRLRARSLPADSHFEPHDHAWAQLAYCASGIVQVTTVPGAAGADDITFIVPPSRAVWIAPGTRHAIHVMQAAEFRTLYIDAASAPAGWDQCRVIMVSPLLRELIHALEPALLPRARETLLSSLVLDEIETADTQSLGVPLPAPGGDKRLRSLCEAVLRVPGARAGLGGWAAQVGASERTLARLFETELGMGWQQWRQQVVLAHALPLLARGTPVGQVAHASGYASESAFSAMFKAAMGQPPRHFHPRQP